MSSFKETYSFKEYAFGNVLNRNQIYEDNTFEFDENEEAYSSHFSFDQSLEGYVQTTGSVKGFTGTHFAEDIVFDFDSPKDAVDLEVVKAEVIKFIQFLSSEYGIDHRYLGKYFSGQKGFHVYIPIEYIHTAEPHEHFSKIIQRLAKKLAEGFNCIDLSMYDQFQLVRLPNSKHGTTALYKVPLTPNELVNCSIDQIKELAHSPRKEERDDPSEILPSVSLTKLFDECRSEVENSLIDAERATEAVDIRFNDKKLDKAVDYMKGRIENYADWISVCYSLISLCNDQGSSRESIKDLFRKISKNNSNYPDETLADINKAFEGCYESYDSDLSERIRIGTFFYIAKRYGFKFNDKTDELRIEGGGYLVQRTLFIRRKDISYQARFIYSLIKTYADHRTHKAFPSHELLSGLSMMSEPTIRKYISELVKMNCLKREKIRDSKGVFLKNVYTIMEDVAEKRKD